MVTIRVGWGGVGHSASDHNRREARVGLGHSATDHSAGRIGTPCPLVTARVGLGHSATGHNAGRTGTPATGHSAGRTGTLCHWSQRG